MYTNIGKVEVESHASLATITPEMVGFAIKATGIEGVAACVRIDMDDRTDRTYGETLTRKDFDHLDTAYCVHRPDAFYLVKIGLPHQLANDYPITDSGSSKGVRVRGKFSQKPRSNWPVHEIATYEEDAIIVIAHELRHVWQLEQPRPPRYVEVDAEWHAARVLEEWRNR